MQMLCCVYSIDFHRQWKIHRAIVVNGAKCLGLSWPQFYSSEAASCPVHTKKKVIHSFMYACTRQSYLRFIFVFIAQSASGLVNGSVAWWEAIQSTGEKETPEIWPAIAPLFLIFPSALFIPPAWTLCRNYYALRKNKNIYTYLRRRVSRQT